MDILESKITEYVKNGGKLFVIKLIDTIRDGGTKVIQCNNGDEFYINKELNKFHYDYPLNNHNEISDELLKYYLLERISVYVERMGDDYNRNKNLLSKLNSRPKLKPDYLSDKS